MMTDDCRQISNISRILLRNKIVYQRQLQDETRDILVLWFGATYIRDLTVIDFTYKHYSLAL